MIFTTAASAKTRSAPLERMASDGLVPLREEAERVFADAAVESIINEVEEDNGQ